MTTVQAQAIIAQLAIACASAIRAGSNELPADTFSAPARDALDALNAAIEAKGL